MTNITYAKDVIAKIEVLRAKPAIQRRAGTRIRLGEIESIRAVRRLDRSEKYELYLLELVDQWDYARRESLRAQSEIRRLKALQAQELARLEVKAVGS